jgi:hypothetical protein
MARVDDDVERTVVVVKLVIGLAITAGLEVFEAMSPQSWLSWWLAPVIGFGVVFGGFWFFFALFDGDL